MCRRFNTIKVIFSKNKKSLLQKKLIMNFCIAETIGYKKPLLIQNNLQK